MSYEPEKLIPAQDLKECAICSRFFTLERINTHEAICQKSSMIQRKSFDIAQQRNRGTEVEKLAKAAATNECLIMLQKNGGCGLSTNWRGKHEDFLKKIKDAKRRASEKNQRVNDLPFPPPVDEDADCVQCQYCFKHFNKASALCHIATCPSKKTNSAKNLTSD